MMVETLPRVQVLSDPSPEVPPVEADGPGPCKRLLTREEYHKMAEAGIFGPDERLELIDGEVYKKLSPQSPRHAYLVRRLEQALGRIFSDEYECRSQLPLVSGGDGEPEPDIAIVPGSMEDYWSQHPKVSDAILLVEIADASLQSDRGAKAALYARTGVPDYWIVNLRNRTVEVYREPAPLPDQESLHGYKSRRVFSEGETLSPLAAPEAALAVSDILPPE
jgi:Uma2 family endonuclease